MEYISTRGGIAPIPFTEAVMMGLATDGGLLLPTRLPTVDQETVAVWRRLSYQDLAFEVLSLFISDIPPTDLHDLILRSYATFNHPEITPVVRMGDCHILELFHGPTLAFKDVALQAQFMVWALLAQQFILYLRPLVSGWVCLVFLRQLSGPPF